MKGRHANNKARQGKAKQAHSNCEEDCEAPTTNPSYVERRITCLVCLVSVFCFVMGGCECARKFPALLIPFPAQGHLNPFLLLSTRLALTGSIVTIVNTERIQRELFESQDEAGILSPTREGIGLDIRFVTIPDGLPADKEFVMDISFECLSLVLEGLQKQQGVLEDIIQSSMSTATPYSCIISDAFLPWTLDIGKKLGIPRVLFCTTGGSVFYMNWIVAAGIHKFGGPWMNTAELPLHPGLRTLHSDILSSFPCDNSPERLQIVTYPFRDIQGNACVILNSFHELEGALVDATDCGVPIRCISPLLAPVFLSGSKEPIEIHLTGSLRKEQVHCLQWLDGHATCSVLYISFGSIATLAPDDLNQLAVGLEASKIPFLWVIREENFVELPEGFEERTGDRGLMISWAPQLRVLSHPAIGGFLTHCGWNSTVESIAMGVPMLCFPIFTDQFVNSMLITKQWKVGLALKEEETLEKKTVETQVREIMTGEKGREVRERVAEVKEAAWKAVRAGGTSFADLASFLQHDTYNMMMMMMTSSAFHNTHHCHS